MTVQRCRSCCESCISWRRVFSFSWRHDKSNRGVVTLKKEFGFVKKKPPFLYSNIRYSLVDILLDLHHLLPGPVQEEAQGAAGLAVLSCNDEFRKIWTYCVVLFPLFLTVLPVRHAPGDHADEVVLQRGGQHGAPLLGHRREQGAAVLRK